MVPRILRCLYQERGYRSTASSTIGSSCQTNPRCPTFDLLLYLSPVTSQRRVPDQVHPRTIGCQPHSRIKVPLHYSHLLHQKEERKFPPHIRLSKNQCHYCQRYLPPTMHQHHYQRSTE